MGVAQCAAVVRRQAGAAEMVAIQPAQGVRHVALLAHGDIRPVKAVIRPRHAISYPSLTLAIATGRREHRPAGEVVQLRADRRG